MNKKIIPGISVFIFLLIPALLVLTGCPPHIDSLYGLKVTGDGTGGAIAVYEDKLGGDVYVQKISSDGKAMWGEKGTLLGSSDIKTYSFFDFNIISDSSGGAIVSWPDPSQDQFRPSSQIARIDSEGELAWQHDFIYFNQMISDGSSGAIIAFDYSIGDVIPGSEEKNLLLVKVDSQGNYPWGLQGITVPRGKYQDNTLQMTSDGSGGVMFIWEELEPQPGAIPGNARNISRLFAQRIDSSGKLLWGNDRGNGMLVYEFPEQNWIESLQVTEDGTGGVIIAWYQVTEDPSAEAGHRQTWDIVVQKIDDEGHILWKPGGVPFEITKADPTALPTEPALVGDGTGGAIVIWRDTRRDASGEASIYTQKIDEHGNSLWQPGGIKVSSTSLNPRPQIIGINPGEVIISYSFHEDGKELRIQKLDSNGQVIWQDSGIPITENGFAGYSIASDGEGGTIVGWGVGKGTFSSEKAYIQRVSADGTLLWGEDGIRLNP